MKEDVTEIVLNIKNLTAKLFCDGPKTVVIDAAGECEVTADSITTDSEVEILNPGMHIATLGAGAKLYMELTLDRGRGYVPAERNKQIQSATGPSVLGVIPVDSIYTPVLKVNYTCLLYTSLTAYRKRLKAAVSSNSPRWLSSATATALSALDWVSPPRFRTRSAKELRTPRKI